LVMITPNSGYVDVAAAVTLGIVAGVVTFSATKLVERYLYRVDDPIGGFPVHGVNGALGSILVPVFANPDISGFSVPGLLYGGGAQAATWFGIQLLGIVIASAIVFVASYGFVKVCSAFMRVRADYDEEVLGLDAVDHGLSEHIPVVRPEAPKEALPSPGA
ncbi:MAG: hypothetical protein M3281_00110, partial [Chloroflexota bacterium]|nr:hypothetical protein [Chloroflexota bacterium]